MCWRPHTGFQDDALVGSEYSHYPVQKSQHQERDQGCQVVSLQRTQGTDFALGNNVEYPDLDGMFIFYNCSYFIKMYKKDSP